jgi:hypothetical protein
VGGLRSDDRSRDGPHTPVQRQLPESRMLREALWGHLARRGQHGERDREIEARALFAEPCGSEVDRDPLERPFELRARDAAAHALLRLLACLVRESDDGEARHAALQVRLDLDRTRLQADERMGERACKHAPKLEGPNAPNAGASSE